MTWRESLAPLREHNFRFYFAARSINLFGTMMAHVALAFAVLEITDDPTALGQVLAAHTIPMVLLLLWGGVIGDRFSRARVLQFSNLTSALSQGAIAVLVITGTAELWMLVVLSVVHGAVSAVSFPALASIMPSLVAREQLQRANALVSLVRGSSMVIAPSVAAMLVVTVGAGWAVGVDAATWLVSAILFGFVRVPREADTSEDDGHGSTFSDLAAGWHYVRSTTWLWVVVLAFALLNMIWNASIITLGPVVAKDTIGEQGWGLVLSAQAAGLLAMTLVLLRFPLRRRPLLLGLAAISTVGVPIALLGAHPTLALVMVTMFVAGAGMEVFGMAWNLAMQEHVPDDMLSRAYSYDALGSLMAMPVGQMAAGPLALAFGYEQVLVVSGVAYAAVALLTLLSSSVRRLPRAEQAPTPEPEPVAT